MTTSWQIPGSDEQTIFGATDAPEGEPVGVMIICHGRMGYKEYGFFPRVARAAAEQGLAALRFNFSHAGVTENYERFERPDLFEKDTYARQIEDLKAVVTALTADEIPGVEWRRQPMVWFGHSRGSATVLLTAMRLFEDADRDPAVLPTPVGLIGAASLSFTNRFSDEQRRRLRQRGSIEAPSNRTGQILRIGKAFLDVMESDPPAYDPLRAASVARCPILFVHGENDGPDAARMLAEAAAAEPVIIPEAGHTFNCPNPLPDDEPAPPATQQMIDASIDFALRQCAGD